MARIGPTHCIGVVISTVIVAATVQSRPPEDPQSAVAATLAVQEAMRQGREALQRGQTKAAVEALEAQLSRINGNAAYLALLREAYSAYVKELQLSRSDDQAAAYLRRLQILDRSANDHAPPTQPPRSEVKSDPPATAAESTAPKADDDPLQQPPRRSTAADRSLIPMAERAFADKRYAEADNLFGRGYGSDTVSPQHASQWAYCKLFVVVGRLKEAEANHAPVRASELEQEIAAAQRLTANDAKLAAFGRQVLDSVRERAASATSPTTMTIRHQERGADGWAKAESTNFRLAHRQSREFAEQLLQSAEQARAAALQKWSSVPRGIWKVPCDVIVHTSAAEYAKATGKPADSPGHATYKSQSGAVIARRLDLRADEPNLLSAVVPHETTHLVLGDLFADVTLPRWADEGMAVLSEPRSRFERFAKTLHSNRRQGKLIPLTQVLGKDEYPEASLITVFYVESVSVVEFLVAEKGPQTFVQFLRDAAKSNLDAALQKHYDFRGIDALQDRWLTKTFSEPDTRAAAAR